MQLDNQNPKVAVLLATYNGFTWLPAQVDSILYQRGVEVTLYVSDDMSLDETYDYLSRCAQFNPQIKILSPNVRLRSAGENFYRLIRDVDITGYDFVAFADQDDIWEQDKLIRHSHLAKKYGADGVSSSVMAFWENNTNKLIVKSQPQKQLDFIFESAGPGCTFLMTPWLINAVKDRLNQQNGQAAGVALHDWLTYAICRAHGRKWFIDPVPSVKYRQHQNNVLGSNSGLKAKWSRLIKLKQGWYRREVQKICNVCLSISDNREIAQLSNLLAKKTIWSHIELLTYIPQARRKFSDRLLLAFSMFFFLF